MNTPAAGPLTGYRILDLTNIIMGPLATQILGDLGAEIDLVEPLELGGSRLMGAGPDDEMSGVALNLLRNKKSISIDLKSPEGRAITLKIAARSDVFVTNLRPLSLKRLGLAYEDVRKINPDIVYCQACGFRSDGDRADDPAYDDIIQAETGFVDAVERTGRTPMLAPTIMADKICGITIANAITAALLHRERTGLGQRVEIAMYDVMRAFMLIEHGAGAISVPASGETGWGRVLSPTRGPQKTSDGWINILPYTAGAYDALFNTGGRDDLVKPDRTLREMMAEAPRLYEALRPIIAERTTSEWLGFCKKHDIPVGKIGRLEELVEELPLAEHPEFGTYHVIPLPIWFEVSPASVRLAAPRLGKHGPEILTELGYSDNEISDLIEKKILRA